MARLQEIRRVAAKSMSSTPETPTASKRSTPNASRNNSNARLSALRTSTGPQIGTFTLDKSRATLEADTNPKKVRTIPPSTPAEKDKAFWARHRNATGSRPSTPHTGGHLPQRPFTAQSTLGSLFDGNLDILRANDVVGIAADFLPALLTKQHSNSSSADMTEEDSDYAEINMRDFVDLAGAAESSSDNDNDDDENNNIFTSPLRGDPYGAPGLLDHLSQGPGLVSSFRRNQNQAKHISSLASHPAKRASTSEQNAL